jgi:hypothetical protein
MAAGSARSWRVLGLTCILTLVGVVDVLLSAKRTTEAPSIERPRLAVVIVFDQMRGDYLERWQGLYAADGGLRRLMNEGAWFQNCHYPYANTVTGAGHASLMTGCSPDRHGIVGNDWYDRAAGTSVYCVFSERHEPVPPPAPGPDGRVRKFGVSPDRLLADTLGDALKAAIGRQCRVFSFSFKDRSAILLAGRQADACYWLDANTGLFGTSNCYRGRLPDWLSDFNSAQPAKRWFGRDWVPLQPDLDYVRLCGPLSDLGKANGSAQGLAFPHPTTGGLKEPGKKYYDALGNSPFGNELLLEVVQRAIDGEKIGQGKTTDLLCISFSSNDLIGHTWGPDSPEVLDVTLRSDFIVRDLLNHLDTRVGRGRYVVALSADHGVCPLPELSQSQGKDAGRVNFAALGVEAQAFLCMHYKQIDGTTRWFESATQPPWFYLNRKLLKELKLEQSEVERTLASWLEKQPGIRSAYTRSRLEGSRPANEDEYRVWRSHHPARSGDVTVVLKPYWIFQLPFAGGTSHGSPHSYDTHVPLLVYGPGIPAGPRGELVTPQAMTPILAQMLSIPAPSSCETELLAKLLSK